MRFTDVSITQSSFPHKRFFAAKTVALIFSISGLAWFQPSLARAATVTTGFQVSAHVVASCKVSPQSLATQSGSMSRTTTLNCGTGSASANAQSSGSGLGTGSPNANANVHYGVSDYPGSDGRIKWVTINF